MADTTRESPEFVVSASPTPHLRFAMPQTVKIAFPAAEGHTLRGYLQLPADRRPSHFALLAHCFSCTKNSRALREIARALNLAGFGVLRFDMTGLGESEGDFAEGGFASNSADLVAAYAYLAAEHTAPALLVGHSLGGTAALCASATMPHVRAVVTIGSPSDPEHVRHHFADHVAEIEARGRATVTLEGRPFDISADFVRSLLGNDVEGAVRESRKALLVMHSPQDAVVDIAHAQRLYGYARHPKSFASLDGADHMLSDRADAHYAGRLIAAWVSRYLPHRPAEDALGSAEAVTVRLDADAGYTTEIMARRHALVADEPESVGGSDFGPGPYELLSAGLGACTAMTLHMYARRKKWPLERVEVELRHFKDYPSDMEAAASAEVHPGEVSASAKPAATPANRIDHFERRLLIVGDALSEEQRARLVEIADRCPVHRTLEAGARVVTRIVDAAPAAAAD